MCMCDWCSQTQGERVGSLEMKLQIIVRHHAGAGNPPRPYARAASPLKP